MDRTLHKISTRYALHLTVGQMRCILLRDVEREIAYRPNLKDLLENTYAVEDVAINYSMVAYSINRVQDTEEEHNLIHNDIETYIEGLETHWTGVDNPR